ncbi:hypothetical protein ID866_8562 [Astraeus odoratus]|nr:hypothetical protein ID866_8562 [Astraeus odoratus]
MPSHGYLAADYHLHARDIDHEEPRSRRRLPIPDLRFEQAYLSRIRGCLHIESPTPHSLSEDAEYTAVTHVVPLVSPSQQVTRIDWRNVAYITFRDQVVMPLLQGMLWGVVGTYYRPLISLAKDTLRGKPAPPHPVEGEGVSWLRRWAKSLGFSSVTIGPLSVQGRS